MPNSSVDMQNRLSVASYYLLTSLLLVCYAAAAGESGSSLVSTFDAEYCYISARPLLSVEKQKSIGPTPQSSNDEGFIPNG